MMSLWDALRMNMMISYQELVRTFPKNLRVIQLLLGHKKLESTVRYLGIEVDDALEISESIEV
ncbi:TPA: hypothetical protein JLU58_004060 [Escherichia coli]|nr:hypothetical protein [Escherichia coli]